MTDIPGARAGARPAPHRPPSEARGGARRARRRPALRPPGRGLGGGERGEHSHRLDQDGVRRDARVQPAGARRARGAIPSSRALPLPDEGARPGSDPQSHRAQAADIKPAIYDGDTESSGRWQIRKWSNLILTNPDMLQRRRPPHHDRWGDVLAQPPLRRRGRGDVYRGVFGSHVGNVLRRLRRLARIYGADPQFLLASATIANPGELAQRLIGVEATTIEHDGAPKADRPSCSGTHRSPTRSWVSARVHSARQPGSWPRSSREA